MFHCLTLADRNGILTNPSYAQIVGQLRRSPYKELRCVGFGGDVFTVDSYKMEHQEMCDALGIAKPKWQEDLGFGFIGEKDLTDIKKMGIRKWFAKGSEAWKLFNDF